MWKLSVLLLLKLTLVWAKSVLLIIADDAGFEAGVFGNSYIKTPHLDFLGTRSLRMENAFTSVSSCSPSRSAILTGLPAHQNGMYGLHQDVHHFDSFDKVRSLPYLLRESGILTGIIGKKHVGPEDAYPFDVAHTEENHPINQVGRNITLIGELVHDFLASTAGRDFFLYVAFHDPHRCGHTNPELGEFCERFGNGEPGMGSIPDWRPQYYKPEEVYVPAFVPDTPAAREDIAAQYTTISRLDQGIGILLEKLNTFNVSDETLVIYSSDNGIPFPNGRTNSYDSGIREPFLISSPSHPKSQGKSSTSLASLLDITPTVLDWFDLPYPDYHIFDKKEKVKLTGNSLLPLLDSWPEHENRKAIFGSHNLHEATMYYPMRFARTKRFKLVHNLNYKSPFPIDQDFFLSPTFQDILERTKTHQKLHWIKVLEQYYYRDEWELFDLKYDEQELYNIFDKPKYAKVFGEMRTLLHHWQNATYDPWICAPHAVLENRGQYRQDPRCMPLYN